MASTHLGADSDLLAEALHYSFNEPVTAYLTDVQVVSCCVLRCDAPACKS